MPGRIAPRQHFPAFPHSPVRCAVSDEEMSSISRKDLPKVIDPAEVYLHTPVTGHPVLSLEAGVWGG